jgi:hypothetical protein
LSTLSEGVTEPLLDTRRVGRRVDRGIVMKGRHVFGVSLAAGVFLGTPGLSVAQATQPTIPLIVSAGRALQIVIDERVSIKSVGQSVTGTLVEPLYAYDRVVVPAGTKVAGHVVEIEQLSRLVRARAILAGSLTPPRHIVLRFDTLLPDAGDPIPIQTVVTAEIPHLERAVASRSEPEREDVELNEGRRLEQDARQRIKDTVTGVGQRARDVLGEIRQPGRMKRLKQAVLNRLPYRPLAIGADTGYQAELLTPIEFGRVTASEPAVADQHPAPSSILSARLVTTIDSSTTGRGTPIRAVVTAPVFSADHRLIFPEGTALEGEVTFATAARRFHRNGKLRFLFERVERPAAEPSELLASLQSVQASADDRVSLDDEGGVSVTNSKTRFIAPALALLALRGTLDRHDRLDPDGDGHVIHSSNPGAVSTGGFFGLGMLGIPLSHVAPPVGIALSIVGAAKTMYSNVLGKGREVRFKAGTLIQLQLPPGETGGQ